MPDDQKTVPHAHGPQPFDRLRKRLRYFYRKRAYAKIFENAGYPKEAKALRDCQETELLAFCRSCGHRWWILNKCRSRVCPLCGFETAKERASFLKALSKHMTHPKMLTLTIPLWKNDPHLGIRFLRNSFNKLKRSVLFRTVKGGAYQIEIKIKDHGYHIHVHALLDCPFMPYQHIFSAWKKITNNPAPQIDIRAATDPRAKEYVCKYAAKSAGFDTHPQDIVDWYLATKGERLFATFGHWYNVKAEQLDPTEFKPLPPQECPVCRKTGTTALARDGPYILGFEAWRDFQTAILRDNEDSRPIVAVQEFLNANRKSKPEEGTA